MNVRSHDKLFEYLDFDQSKLDVRHVLILDVLYTSINFVITSPIIKIDQLSCPNLQNKSLVIMNIDKINPQEEIVSTHHDICTTSGKYHVLTYKKDRYYLYTFQDNTMIKFGVAYQPDTFAIVCFEECYYLVVELDGVFAHMEYDWENNLIENYSIKFPTDDHHQDKYDDYNEIERCVIGDKIVYIFTSESKTKIAIYEFDELVFNRIIEGVHQPCAIGIHHLVVGGLVIDTRTMVCKELDLHHAKILKFQPDTLRFLIAE